MDDRSSVALLPSPALWPPDDAEESVLGTNLHQTTIRVLIGGINEAAALAVAEGAPALWQAGGQTMIREFRRPDGTSYTTLPDVFVYRIPWNDTRGSLSVLVDGPPVLIVEVLSEETYKADLDLEQGKGHSYRVAGVAEYLAMDPSHAFVDEGGRGWQLADGKYRPWGRDAAGRWASGVLPLAFGLEGTRAAVYAADGHRFLREGEVERALRAARAEHERWQDEVTRLRRRLEELERDQRDH